jgi:hypothetical protein
VAFLGVAFLGVAFLGVAFLGSAGAKRQPTAKRIDAGWLCLADLGV